jgi:hypothetical protein
VRLSSVPDPGVDTGIVLHYQAKGDGSTDLVVRLKQGVTTVATWTETNAADTDTIYSHTLTEGEAANIDWELPIDVELEAA